MIDQPAEGKTWEGEFKELTIEDHKLSQPDGPLPSKFTGKTTPRLTTARKTAISRHRRLDLSKYSASSPAVSYSVLSETHRT